MDNLWFPILNNPELPILDNPKFPILDSHAFQILDNPEFPTLVNHAFPILDPERKKGRAEVATLFWGWNGNGKRNNDLLQYFKFISHVVAIT